MNHPDTADETTCNERIESRELLVFFVGSFKSKGLKSVGKTQYKTKGMYQYLCAGVMIFL